MLLLVKRINKKVLLRWVGVSVLFFLITWLYMGPSLTHSASVVLSKPGDHTAGIMYNTWVHPGSPLLGFSGLTNYPFGENLRQPLALTSFIPSTAHLILSHFTNVVFAWNLLVLFGYMSTAIVMFGMMHWLTKNWWVAFIVAYAVTYTPYHVFASWGQIAGLLGGIFTLALWQFLAMWRRPSMVKATRLGTILGIGFYTDGYFVLIGVVMLLALWIAVISYALIIPGMRGKIKRQLRDLALATTTALVMVLPLVWINFHYASRINSIFGNARGNIAHDAQTYSAQLPMYLNPKTLLFLGFSLVLLAFVGLWFTWQEYIENRKKRIGLDSQLFVGWMATVLCLLAIWISLRPKVSIWGITLYNPSSLIISLTSSWRVFGRLYALVIIGVGILAGLGLMNLIHKHPTRRYWVIGLIMFLLAGELWVFRPNTPGNNFNYTRAPSEYYWLKDNPNVRAVAEYPLDEPPQGSYLSDYYTLQEISKKPLLNTLLPNSPETPLRRSIGGINDPQTLPVLRALGIDLVNIRPVDSDNKKLDVRIPASKNTELQRIFSYNKVGFQVDSFIIKPGPVANYALVVPHLQYFQILLKTDGGVDYMLDDDTELAIVRLPNSVESNEVRVSFNASSDSERSATIVQNGKTIWSGTLSSDTQNISFNALPNHSVTIYNQKSAMLTHLTLSKLQVID